MVVALNGKRATMKGLERLNELTGLFWLLMSASSNPHSTSLNQPTQPS